MSYRTVFEKWAIHLSKWNSVTFTPLDDLTSTVKSVVICKESFAINRESDLEQIWCLPQGCLPSAGLRGNRAGSASVSDPELVSAMLVLRLHTRGRRGHTVSAGCALKSRV